MMTDAAECILVVDDDASSLELVKGYLEAAGYQVLTANSALKALRLLQEYRPAVVLSDWLMPGMDGLELCRQIRRQTGDPNRQESRLAAAPAQFCYFIMLTINSDKDRLMEAFATGVDDFLAKPFHQGELLARIGAAVRMARLCKELLERTATAERLNTELEALNRKLRQQASTDDLTGLCNRRFAMHRVRELWAYSDRYGEALSCAILDIDHFKRINDTWGHLKGDEILQQIAQVLAGSVRTTDVVCRIGGEEFLILLPKQALQQAATCAERCRASISRQIQADPQRQVLVTVSAGVAQRTRATPSWEALLKLADDCLYKAKEAGRNRIIMVADGDAIQAPAGASAA